MTKRHTPVEPVHQMTVEETETIPITGYPAGVVPEEPDTTVHVDTEPQEG